MQNLVSVKDLRNMEQSVQKIRNLKKVATLMPSIVELTYIVDYIATNIALRRTGIH